MDTKYLEHFVQLAKSEHVSETADFFNLSQPALSRNIVRLEEELGVKLFDRTRNRIHLNANGKVYRLYAEQILELLKEGEIAVNNVDNTIHGNINISYSVYPPYIMDLVLDYSTINPYVTFSTARANEEADFIFLGMPNNGFVDKEKSWVTQPLFTEKMLLVASPKYPGIDAYGRTVHVSEICNAPFVGFVTSNFFIDKAVEAMREQLGFRPKAIWRENQLPMKLRIVATGKALAFVPECALEDAKKLYPDLRYYELEGVDTERTIYIRCKKETLVNDLFLDFWYFILDYFHIEATNPIESGDETYKL